MRPFSPRAVTALISAAVVLSVACSSNAPRQLPDPQQPAGGQAGSAGAGGQAGTAGISGVGGASGNDASTSTTTGGTGGGTGFGQFVPREEFCSHAPRSGIAVPDPRLAISNDPSVPAPDVEHVCTGDLAKRTFRFGLCTCQDLAANGTLTTDSFNSTTGALGKDGSVGVRTRMVAMTLFNIGGSLWAAGLDAAPEPVLEINGSNVVAGQLRVGGDVGGSSFFDVGKDAFVAGGFGSSVFTTVHGTLHQPSGAALGGTNPLGGSVTEPVTVADPCNCEAPLDIDTIVSAFQTQNDNAASGVATSALIAPNGTNLTLECGRYYFEGAQIGGGTTTLHLEGRTALFVHGDFNIASLLSVQLDPGAELDLFITGNVMLSGASEFGQTSAPAKIRMYVGGTSVELTSLATLGANIYARRATFTANGTLSLWGSLYADKIALTTLADFHFDSAVLETEGCEPPGQMCKDCQGCSAGSCIAGACAPCQSGADCCAPLTCQAGACVLVGQVD